MSSIGAAMKGRGISATEVLERGGLPLLLIALVVFFSLDGSSGSVFRSGPNIDNILANQSVTAVIALAMVAPLTSGYFDLSVGAVAGLTNVTFAAVSGSHGDAIVVGIVVAMVVGLIAGAINGFLVGGLKLNGFVVTLGTFILIGGLIQWYTGGQTITSLPPSLAEWTSEKWLGVPRPFWILIAIALIVWYVLMHTPFGRRLEAIGSNERGAHLVGIRVERTVFLSFIFSALLASMAGILLSAKTGVADPTAAQSYLFPSLTAVFLGMTTIRPGRFNVWGTLIAVFVVAVAVSGLTLLGADSWVTPVFNGAALVLAVALSTLMGRRRERQALAASRREYEEGRGVGDREAPIPV
jgi:ribose transport system permease protein